jgi:hypothetical protein
VRLPPIVLLGLIPVVLSACLGTATSGPTAAAASPTPTSTDDPVINTVPLTSMSSAETCALLTVAEATKLLARPLDGTPTGVSDGGDHVGCLYQVQGNQVVGMYIKIAINRIGFDGLAAVVNLHRGAHTLEVGGFQAIGADSETDPVNDEAVLSVKLAKNSADPALWIEAPTSDSAKAVAELVLPRLQARH